MNTTVYDDSRVTFARVYCDDPSWAFHHVMSEQDRIAFDQALVEHQHPLAYEAGTGEQRFNRFCAEVYRLYGTPETECRHGATRRHEANDIRPRICNPQFQN